MPEEHKQTERVTLVHESRSAHTGRHESAFVFTAEQTEKGGTSCVYL